MHSFVFSKKTGPRLARHLVFWGLYFAGAVITYLPPIGAWAQIDRPLLREAIFNTIAYLPVYLLAVYSALYFMLPRYLGRKNNGFLVLYAVLLLAVSIPAGFFITKLIFKTHGYGGNNLDVLSMALQHCMADLVTITGAAIIIKILKDYFLQQRESEMLAVENIRNKLQLLKMQMHPRLLFASLTRIHTEIDAGTREAPEMILRLSDLLSYLLYESDSDRVPREGKMINNYIERPLAPPRRPRVATELTWQVLFWVACFLVAALSYPPHGAFGPGNGVDVDGVGKYYEMVMIRTFFHLLCQMIFCYPFLYFLVPVFLWKRRYPQFAGMVLLLLAVTSLLRFLIFLFIYNPIMRGLNFYVNSLDQIAKNSIIQNFEGPAFVGFLFISLKLFKDWQQKQKDNLDLRKENANAELLLLKAQIHPHFLFNTLNNIYSFALDRSPQAKKMIKMLEDMLHYMIDECQQPLVSLEKEITVLKDYFELERIRYGNSMDMQFEVAGDYDGKVVSPLLMIPFVENSFKHGTSKILREPWIKLYIQADDDIVHFSLTNSKPAEETVNHKRGIGLANVKKRLELLYPDAHLLTIDSTKNTFTVNMQIPITRQ
jgi:sensor histidine kinase YesM